MWFYCAAMPTLGYHENPEKQCKTNEVYNKCRILLSRLDGCRLWLNSHLLDISLPSVCGSFRSCHSGSQMNSVHLTSRETILKMPHKDGGEYFQSLHTDRQFIWLPERPLSKMPYIDGGKNMRSLPADSLSDCQGDTSKDVTHRCNEEKYAVPPDRCCTQMAVKRWG